MAFLKHISKEPVSSTLPVGLLDLIKSHLHIDFGDDDTLLTFYIKSAIEFIETYCGRVLLESNCTATYVQDGEGDFIKLLYADNIVLDADSGYEVKAGGITTTDKEVTISYKAGYTSLPSWAVHAIMTNVAYRYTHRNDENVNPSEVDVQTRAYLQNYIMWNRL